MTKNTKIALAVAGAIALYFILRPKAQAQVTTPTSKDPEPQWTAYQQKMKEDAQKQRKEECSNLLTQRLMTVRMANLEQYKTNFMNDCTNYRGEFEIKMSDVLKNLPIQITQKTPNTPCNCVMAPCNC